MKNKRFSLFLAITFVYFSTTANIAFGDAGADRIDLRYPAVAENPANLAVGIMLDPPLMPGQTLNIYCNGQLANSIKASGFSVKRYNPGLRLAGNGMIEVRILDQQGQVLASKSVKPEVLTALPESPIPASRHPLPEPFVKAKRPSVRKRSNGDISVKVSVEHALKLGQVGYIDFKSSAGTVTVSLTPYSVPRRYLNFILDRDPGSFEVSTRLE
jgi:hypothetical protein